MRNGFGGVDMAATAAAAADDEDPGTEPDPGPEGSPAVPEDVAVAASGWVCGCWWCGSGC